MNNKIRGVLNALSRNEITVDEALVEIKREPFENIDFAKVDTQRAIRQGIAEVIYAPGKTVWQLDEIISTMQKAGQEMILVTKLQKKEGEYLKEKFGMNYCEVAKIGTIGKMPEPDGLGTVLVVTAGTGDIYAAEEAAITLEALGNKVKRIYDLGVSTPQALNHYLPDILSASVIITLAGMEGALACVLAGYADCPIIAVPTSVGYGACFDGLAALLSMLTACSSGVSVVNIDNGFGAGYQASMINHMRAK